MSILNKINTFRRAPLKSAQIKFNMVYMRRLIGWWSKRKLASVGFLGIISEFHKKRPPSSTKPVWADLWFLYKNVRERKPRVIWEFGSGCSTLALAYALWKNSKEGHKGFMYSIDSEESWGNSTRSLTPGFLLPFYELVRSPTVKAGSIGLRHTVLPDAIPDFVYFDGPVGASTEGYVRGQPIIAVDLLAIEQKLPNDFFLVVDCRRDNVHFLQHNLKRKYKFWRRKYIPQYIFELE